MPHLYRYKALFSERCNLKFYTSLTWQLTLARQETETMKSEMGFVALWLEVKKLRSSLQCKFNLLIYTVNLV
ncbi:hypothetical protein VCHA41O245_30216 [Vibrio chagasii]|nr:hypothetical protein VCHA41O245_30216 [Vibrio chagasii]